MTNSRFAFPPIRRRAVIALATVGAGILIAGCGGSSSNSSTITIGNESTQDSKLITAGVLAKATTPTSGPLSKEPTVTPPTGAAPKVLIKKDLIVGTGPEAKTGDPVVVNYVGVLYKGGKEFDASWKRKEPFSFTLGKQQVISGWDQGVAGMKVGGRRELIIPPALGYGASGSSPSIPPNATLVFVIDLLAV